MRAHVAVKGEIKKRDAGERLPASYVNFYLANGGAVIPAFGEATDEPCACSALLHATPLPVHHCTICCCASMHGNMHKSVGGV